MSYNGLMALLVETLVVDEHRIAHIARHDITVEEVRDVVSGDFVYIQGRQDRWLLIGQTAQGRFLTVVVGARAQSNTYGLVTARPARREERRLYQELQQQQQQGGEGDD
ncbi:MAG TPA: hypothetical protein VIU62_19115 [Chloroflexota bacterium]